MKFTYKNSGVDYSLLDPAKRMSQIAGLKTVKNLLSTSYKEISQSRGETAYIIEGSDCYYALVEEGLGTKNLVADQVRKITAKTYYDAIAQDTVAAIVNDLITVGAEPLTVLAYWAVGDSGWFKDERRLKDLIDGWKKACDLAQVTWGGGETPSNKDLINPNTIVLAGSAFGIVKPKKSLILGDKIKPGDVIIFFESNGIHANGLSLTRKIAQKLPQSFATKLPSNKLFGDEILKPSIIYVKLITDLLSKNIDIHYMINITGHGWKKLMRARKSFRYVIDKINKPPELFTFIQKISGLSDEEMYATFNMGAGFAIVVSADDAEKALAISKKNKIRAWIGGKVEKGPKQVIIKPLNIIYKSNELGIR